MKYLALLLLFVASVSRADSVELDAGVGQGTKPFYGADYQYQFNGLPYLDFSLTGNSQYLQPYVSFGFQFTHINVGLGHAVSLYNITSGGPVSAHYGIGPEVGYQQNLNSLIFVKENNTYLRTDGSFGFSATFSVGINL